MKKKLKSLLLLILLTTQQFVTVYGVTEGEQINTEEEEV
jgi:hypothetical protein